jgi:hypothetical protein
MTTTPAGEVIYEVEARLDPSVVAAFDAWLPGHVREVLACQGFTGAEVQVPLDPAGEGPALRRTQYRLESMAALTRYLAEDAPRLRADAVARFGDLATFERRLFTPASVPLRLPEAPVTCRNCGAAVTGRHCAGCGQSRDIHVLSMNEVLGDVTHSLLHLDSRVWRTLKALVLRPGLLTNEFIAGRHQLYLPPFRLYLVISILFFTLSALLPEAEWLHTDAEGRTVVAIGRPAGQHDGPRSSRDAAELDEVIGDIQGALPASDAGTGDATRERAPCDLDLAGSRLAPLEPRIEEVCRKLRADGGKRLGEAFLANAPRLMFVFLPLMAAVAMLFYWKPRRLYAEHLVMMLHTHALLFLVLAASNALEAAAVTGLPLAVWLHVPRALLLAYVPWYVYRAMRIVYGEGRLRTAVKFAAISSLYFILLGFTLAAGLVYSALSL